MHIRGVQELELPDGFLGAVFLNGSDQNIRDDDRDEEHVPVAADEEKAGRQREVQKIEEGENIVKENFFQGFALVIVQHVAEAGLPALLRLLRGETAFIGIGEIFRPAAWQLQFVIHYSTSRLFRLYL